MHLAVGMTYENDFLEPEQGHIVCEIQWQWDTRFLEGLLWQCK